MYRGALTGFGAAQVAALRGRGALGASDLERALVWTAEEARATGAQRVVLVGDGLATAGSADLVRLRGAARALGSADVQRLDVVALGEMQGASTLRALARALPRDGMVIDGTRPPVEIAARLLAPSRSQVQVGLPGARWIGRRRSTACSLVTFAWSTPSSRRACRQRCMSTDTRRRLLR